MVQNELKINLTETEIKQSSKWQWKKLVKETVKSKAFEFLVSENSSKEKTEDIKFDKLSMSEYLNQNLNTTLAKTIFAVRSKTLDIKSLQPWKYDDNLCVYCHIKEENMNHFMSCTSYEKRSFEYDWKDILKNDIEKQYKIAQIVFDRMNQRQDRIYEDKGGHPLSPGCIAPED